VKMRNALIESSKNGCGNGDKMVDYRNRLVCPICGSKHFRIVFSEVLEGMDGYAQCVDCDQVQDVRVLKRTA